MAHEKPQHDYHLVNPSPWPAVASLSLFLLTFGAAGFFHDRAFGLPMLGAGVLGVLYVMYVWWRDVIREGMYDGSHTKVVQNGMRFGMALFIVSEVMFFAAFFWAFFNASLMPVTPVNPMDNVWGMSAGVWPPEGVETFDPWNLPFMNTLILLLSGTTVTWAHHALLHNNRKDLVQALAITVALGAIFSCVQVFEYMHATFPFTGGVYSSTFYLTTGFHGLHVFIGTIFLLVCLLRARKGQLDTEHHLGFEFAAWYWHFVDVVWLFLFVFIYVWGA